MVDDGLRPYAHNFAGERQLCPRKYAGRNVHIFRRCKASCRNVKQARAQPVAHPSWPSFDVVKAVVAHRGVLLIAPARWIDFIAFTYTDATRSLTEGTRQGRRSDAED